MTDRKRVSQSCCRLCGLAIQQYEESVCLNAQNGRVSTCLYHKNCFKCTVCKRLLSVHNYFLSSKRRFYCVLHCDFESGLSHSSTVRNLKSFKANAREKLGAILNHASPYGSPRDLHPDDFTNGYQGGYGPCYCQNKNNMVVPTPGHWTECVIEGCPYNNYIKKKNKFMLRDHSRKISDEPFELEHYDEEIYENCFLDDKHFNYYAVDDELGPTVLSLKQELLREKEYFRVLVRSSSHIVEGLLPASSICANKYNEADVVEALGREVHLTSSLRPFTDSKVPEKLCQLDQVMLKNDFKVGVIFVKEGQEREEEFFSNTEHTEEFESFLSFLGERVQLKGFPGYNGGLDTQYGLTGKTAVYAEWQKYHFMFHVSTLLPLEENDDQRLQRKRHIGNDIVCLVFLSSDDIKFNPSAITSNFLHNFIVIRPDISNKGNKCYQVTVVSKSLVLPYGPPVPQDGCFDKGTDFKNWLMTKIINAERASYRAPKFAAMHERTRRQLLTEVVHNQAYNANQQVKSKDKTGGFPKLFGQKQNGKPASIEPPKRPPRLFPDWTQERFEDVEQLQKDFSNAFNGFNQLHDVAFIVGLAKQKVIPGVKAILASRSRVFHDMFYESHSGSSHSSPGSSPNTSPKQSPKQSLGKTKSAPGTSRPGIKKKLSFERLKVKKSKSLSKKDEEVEQSGRPVVTDCLITEFEPDEFSILMEYMHTGSCIIYPEILPHLLCAADHYEAQSLVKSCLKAFDDLVTVNNVCTMLVSVRKMSSKYSMALELQRKIMFFIEQNALRVFQTFDIASLSEDCFTLVMSQPLNIDEMLKFDVISSWIQRNYEKGVHEVDTLLKDQLASMINLEDIENEDLMKFLRPSGLFSQERIDFIVSKRK